MDRIELAKAYMKDDYMGYHSSLITVLFNLGSNNYEIEIELDETGIAEKEVFKAFSDNDAIERFRSFMNDLYTNYGEWTFEELSQKGCSISFEINLKSK